VAELRKSRARSYMGSEVTKEAQLYGQVWSQERGSPHKEKKRKLQGTLEGNQKRAETCSATGEESTNKGGRRTGGGGMRSPSKEWR